jgi:hypothetical protein
VVLDDVCCLMRGYTRQYISRSRLCDTELINGGLCMLCILVISVEAKSTSLHAK